MQTAPAVLDGKRRLSNEELGLMTRKVSEIQKRIESGTISFEQAQKGLQYIIEGKAEDIGPCRKRHQSATIEFKRPSVKQRKRSKAPMRVRLPFYLNRLYFHYKLALQTGRFGRPAPKKLSPEDFMAQMWEAENIPNWSSNNGRVPVQGILDNFQPPEREVAIVASTLQWLSTNVGLEFLRRFVLTANISI